MKGIRVLDSAGEEKIKLLVDKDVNINDFTGESENITLTFCKS